jgi:hypothetical protein
MPLIGIVEVVGVFPRLSLVLGLRWFERVELRKCPPTGRTPRFRIGPDELTDVVGVMDGEKEALMGNGKEEDVKSGGELACDRRLRHQHVRKSTRFWRL